MRFGGIVLLAALLLGACSDDPEPREPEPGPSTSATPAPPAPTMPPQASEDSPEGAAAFVAHYIDVFNHAAATGDVDELEALSSPDCEGCQSYIELYEDTYAAGGYFKGGEWEPGEILIEFGDPETYATTTISADETRFRMSADEPEERGAAEETELAFAVLSSANEKRISQLALGDDE